MRELLIGTLVVGGAGSLLWFMKWLSEKEWWPIVVMPILLWIVFLTGRAFA